MSGALQAVFQNFSTPAVIGGNIGPAYAVPDSYIYSAVAGLTSSAMLICYRDNLTGYFRARVGSISGTSISYDTAAQISTIITGFRPAACSLTSTLGLVGWADASNSYIAAMSISGTTVTVGTTVTTGYRTQNAIAFAPLTSTTALALFRDIDNDRMKAFVVSVAGTTVSLGTAIGFGGQNGSAALSALSSTSVMGFYGGNTTYVNAVPLTVSGTTVSAGTIVTNINLGIYVPASAPISGSYVVEVAGTNGGTTETKVRLVDSSGNPQTEFSITDSNFSGTMISCPDGKNIQVFYTTQAGSRNATFLSVSGTSLVAQSGTSSQTVSGTNGWIHGGACTISSTKTAFSYWNNAGDGDEVSVRLVY